MPGLFIDVVVSKEIANDPKIAAKLAEVCPVNIFRASNAGVQVVETNLDECTLCDLCQAVVPKGSVAIIKLYERGSAAPTAPDAPTPPDSRRN